MRGSLAALAVVAGCAVSAVAQAWRDLPATFPAPADSLAQACRDLTTDAFVLLVASHPDDRYLLPAAWLRWRHGCRVAVLLATRGGGGQNSAGDETGDAFERIRTRETEVGCARLGIAAFHLDRPDGGFRRTAVDTFAEWGRDGTRADLARLLRRIRPDAVLTTHHAAEQHGHDLALIELLPEAMALAADPAFVSEAPPHAVGVYMTGIDDRPASRTLAVDVSRPEPGLGVSLREHAYAILCAAHRSPGAPAPLAAVFDAQLQLAARTPRALDESAPALGLPSAFAPAIWPFPDAAGEQWAGELARLAADAARSDRPIARALQLRRELVALRQRAGEGPFVERLDRRIAALERVALQLAEFSVRVRPLRAPVAVVGEPWSAHLELAWREGPLPLPEPLAARADAIRWRLAPVAGVEATVLDGEPDGWMQARAATVTLRVPRTAEADPMAACFRAERFVPPLRLQLDVQVGADVLPVALPLPVEVRPPLELQARPAALLLPTARQSLQCAVVALRHGQEPFLGEVEVRAVAGYAIARDRAPADLREQTRATATFDVVPPADRRPGVDVLRIRLGDQRIEVPVHKIDVAVPPGLRVGLVRSRDETLANLLGPGGLGIAVTDLDDAALAAGDFGALDTVVVDVRATRERSALRGSFDRLLAFAAGRGKRLVVLYQKDVEFQPPGEAFVGAPFQPFVIGKARVTRADAPVRALRRDHPLLVHPNRIRAEDWDGWDQERALYLPSAWAESCEAVLELHDPGQPPERGALLHARHGDGEYVYCALSLWRQLKKLHPGAVRLMVNLLSPTPAN